MVTKRLHLGKDEEEQPTPPSQQKATALGYDPLKDAAPRVVASGKGRVAQQIIEIAQANNIPLREDPILAEALATLDVSQEIPVELYSVVAEIFAYIYRVREKHAGR